MLHEFKIICKYEGLIRVLYFILNFLKHDPIDRMLYYRKMLQYNTLITLNKNMIHN
jgi:hypothetical protein